MSVESEKVSISKDLIVSLIGAIRQIRTGFLICAPRFAAGSRGEAILAIASSVGSTVDEIERQISVVNPGKRLDEK